jgi:hypothetical protein
MSPVVDEHVTSAHWQSPVLAAEPSVTAQRGVNRQMQLPEPEQVAVDQVAVLKNLPPPLMRHPKGVLEVCSCITF